MTPSMRVQTVATGGSVTLIVKVVFPCSCVLSVASGTDTTWPLGGSLASMVTRVGASGSMENGPRPPINVEEEAITVAFTAPAVMMLKSAALPVKGAAADAAKASAVRSATFMGTALAYL